MSDLQCRCPRWTTAGCCLEREPHEWTRPIGFTTPDAIEGSITFHARLECVPPPATFDELVDHAARMGTDMVAYIERRSASR